MSNIETTSWAALTGTYVGVKNIEEVPKVDESISNTNSLVAVLVVTDRFISLPVEFAPILDFLAKAPLLKDLDEFAKNFLDGYAWLEFLKAKSFIKIFDEENTPLDIFRIYSLDTAGIGVDEENSKRWIDAGSSRRVFKGPYKTGIINESSIQVADRCGETGESIANVCSAVSLETNISYLEIEQNLVTDIRELLTTGAVSLRRLTAMVGT